MFEIAGMLACVVLAYRKRLLTFIHNNWAVGAFLSCGNVFLVDNLGSLRVGYLSTLS